MKNSKSTPDYSALAQRHIIEQTIKKLQEHNISAQLVETKEQAKETVLALIPKQAEVMTMTSVSLEQAGIARAINESGDYHSVKNQLMTMKRETHGGQMQKLGAAPEWAVGSVHAVTVNGQVLVVSNSGSQLPAYVYGSPHVIWVVSTKKIVATLEEGIQRTEEHVVPKETARAQKAYSLPNTWSTFMSKMIVINREPTLNRIHIVFVHEDIGF